MDINSIVFTLFSYALLGILVFSFIVFIGLYIKYKLAKSFLNESVDKVKPFINDKLFTGLKELSEVNSRKDKSHNINGGYSVSLHKKRLINLSEERLFELLNKLIGENQIKAYIFTQVSYGEIIGTSGKDAFAAFQTFNSKRADFLIVDYSFNPIFVVEYHGEGHFKGADMTRSDGIKQAACKGAGIGYLAIHYKDKNNLIEYLEIELLPKLKEIIGAMSNG